VHDLLAQAIESETADLDPSLVWTGIEQRLEESEDGSRPPIDLARWRLAAASQRMSGVLLGGTRGGVASRQDPDAEWLLPATRRGFGRLPIAGLAALAAAAVVAFALVPSETTDKPETALVEPSRQVATARTAVPATRSGNRQVQVEAVSFPRNAGAVAMWSEPATETTVIWIDDEEAGRP
jgi:hypothetical protein